MIRPRIAIVCDFREENWPSMDLVGEMLAEGLEKDYSDRFELVRVCPPMRRRFGGEGISAGWRFNADRFVNRFWDYPRWLRKRKRDFDLFHIVDHSYSQLAHELPDSWTIVTCHDLDTFRCLLYPEEDPRSLLFGMMTRRILKGFCKAARVICDSEAIRAEVIRHGLVSPERTRVIPQAVHPTYVETGEPGGEGESKRWLEGLEGDNLDLLHVGSTVPRKRIDLLLHLFGELKKEVHEARLVHVGGPFTREQMRLVTSLGLKGSITMLPFLPRNVLASVYRHVALLLLPSEREGFGFPILEAMACGTPVVASDLPVLREVGGEAAVYCPGEDPRAWSETVMALLQERKDAPERWESRRKVSRAHAAQFSLPRYTQSVVAVYQEVLNR